jgi:plasmid replication initiation protein
VPKKQTKTRELAYNENHNTVMANDIVKGKQEMTLQEARLLRLLITQIAQEDKDLMTYTTKISELAEFLGIPKNNLYRDVRDICRSLIRRGVSVGTRNPRQPWKEFQWLQLAEYDGNGNITLMLSNQIKPFVIGLSEYFTQYKLANILAMNSVYAIRLYELLKCNDHKRVDDYPTYTVKELRQAFECEKKYKLFADFKRYTIDVSVREINTKTDLYISRVEYIKDSRAVVGLKFIYGYLKPQQLPGQFSLDGGEVD